jgi:hypothetical protein
MRPGEVTAQAIGRVGSIHPLQIPSEGRSGIELHFLSM